MNVQILKFTKITKIFVSKLKRSDPDPDPQHGMLIAEADVEQLIPPVLWLSWILFDASKNNWGSTAWGL
jgi:hypothetical protein